jgi:hypothetical protein
MSQEITASDIYVLYFILKKTEQKFAPVFRYISLVLRQYLKSP